MGDSQDLDSAVYRGLRQLKREAEKKSFSIKIMERMLILANIYALISEKLQKLSLVRKIFWLPDRDNLTTYCETAWWELAVIILNEQWRTKKNIKNPAEIGIIRPSTRYQQGEFDPLIRVPDFLAAAISRWDLTNNVILPPDGANLKSLSRYANVIAHWFADNPNIWTVRLRFQEDFLQTTRLSGIRTKRRVRRLSLK